MLSLTRDQLTILSTSILLAPLLALLLAWASMPLRRIFEPPAGALGWATRLLSGLSLICSALVALASTSEPLEFTFVVDFYLDALSVYFLLLVNLVAFFASWYTVEYLHFDARHGEHHNPAFFHLFFNAFHLTMLVVPMVDNLVILWVAIELTTLASTLLVRYRRRRGTLEAAWKYIILTTAGIVFALFGTILLTDAIRPDTCLKIAQEFVGPQAACSDLPSSELLRWSRLAHEDVAGFLDPTLVTLSFLFVFIGYGTKAGFAPMHTWLPDGHGEAPSPVSALLSGVLLKSALYAILRFYTITNLNQSGNEIFTSSVLLFSGLFSLILATPFILKHNKFKRILAYHSLEHMGIISFGLGIGGELALFGALLHALNHALTKALMFLTFGFIRREYIHQTNIPDLEERQITGVLRSMPISGLVLLVGGLGLVGSPPFNIFFSEFIILWAAFDRITPPHAEGQLPAGIYVLAVAIFLITVTLIFGGLVAHLARLLLDRPPFRRGREDPLTLLPLLVLVLMILIFGITVPDAPVNFPELLSRSTDIVLSGPGGGP